MNSSRTPFAALSGGRTRRMLALAGLLTLAPAWSMAMGAKPKNPAEEEAVNARIQAVAKVKLGAPAAATPAGNRSGEELYKSVCGACHETGAANAPKIGDKAAWAPRLAQGLDGLVKSAKAGKNAMPPNGGSNATEEELKRAIIFITGKSGASFK